MNWEEVLSRLEDGDVADDNFRFNMVLRNMQLGHDEFKQAEIGEYVIPDHCKIGAGSIKIHPNQMATCSYRRRHKLLQPRSSSIARSGKKMAVGRPALVHNALLLWRGVLSFRFL